MSFKGQDVPTAVLTIAELREHWSQAACLRNEDEGGLQRVTQAVTGGALVAITFGTKTNASVGGTEARRSVSYSSLDDVREETGGTGRSKSVFAEPQPL